MNVKAETVEEFLARGGKIRRFDEGVSTIRQPEGERAKADRCHYLPDPWEEEPKNPMDPADDYEHELDYWLTPDPAFVALFDDPEQLRP